MAGGPVPAPRVVGNRRIRTGGIALATMLLAFGAALSGIALISVSKTSAYLAVKQPVSVGSPIAAGDLTTVQLTGGSGLTLIPATAVRTVVGRRALVSLVPGTLLSPGQLTDTTLVGVDQAQVGITIKAANLPSVRFAPGDQITLVPLAVVTPTGNGTRSDGTTDATEPATIPATVVDISKAGSDGVVTVHVAVSADVAPTLVMLNANGGVGIVLKAGS